MKDDVKRHYIFMGELADQIKSTQKEIKGRPDMPRVSAKLLKGSFVILCPYCSKKHHHGAMLGHRHSHCGGYYDRKEKEWKNYPSNPGYIIDRIEV